MTFNQTPANASVFLDANILVYYFAPDPLFGADCKLLMDRIARYLAQAIPCTLPASSRPASLCGDGSPATVNR